MDKSSTIRPIPGPPQETGSATTPAPAARTATPVADKPVKPLKVVINLAYRGLSVAEITRRLEKFVEQEKEHAEATADLDMGPKTKIRLL